MKIFTITVNDYRREIRVIKHHWAKRMTLKISNYGQVSVSMPRYATYKQAKKFIELNYEWIEERTKSKNPITHRPGTNQEIKQARKLIQAKLEHWNHIFDQEWNKVFIRNQTTRWGSCSSVNNLSFNWRVINLPPHLQDYLVVHELAHIIEHNHSQKFWQQVARALPDYKVLKRELANYSLEQ